MHHHSQATRGTGLQRLGHMLQRTLTGALLAVVAVMAAPVGHASAQSASWVLQIDDRAYNPTAVGGTVVYAITATNTAGSASAVTALAFDIPGGAVFTGSTGNVSGCTAAPVTGPATITCSIPALPPLGVGTLNASVKALTAGTLAVVAHIPPGLAEDARAFTRIQNQADLGVAINAPGNAGAGESIDFSFTVTNQGPNDARDVTLRVPVPSGMVNVSPPAGCLLSGGAFSCFVAGPLAPNASFSSSFQGQLTTPGTTVSVVGSVSASGSADLVPGNDLARAEIAVNPGFDLKITKSRQPTGNVLLNGQTITFTLQPTYVGGLPALVTVTDTLPAQYEVQSVTPASGSGWICPPPSGQIVTCTLSPGGTAYGAGTSLGNITIVVLVRPGASGNAQNKVEIAPGAPEDKTPGNNIYLDDNPKIQSSIIDLAAKADWPSSMVPGGNALFEDSVLNDDTTAANGTVPFFGQLVMTHSVPAGLTFEGYGSTNGWSCTPAAPPVRPGPQVIRCTRSYAAAAPLAPGQRTPPVQLKIRAPSDFTGSTGSTLAVSFVSPDYTEDYTANNTVSSGIGTVDPRQTADVVVTKTALNPSVSSGDPQTFTITVINNGPLTATNVALSDMLSGLINSASTGGNPGYLGQTVASNSASGVVCGSSAPGTPSLSRLLSCTIAQLPVCSAAAGTCPVITVSVKPGLNGNTRTNSAYAVSNSIPDPDVDNNVGTVDYEVLSRADVSLKKEASTPGLSGPAVGTPFTYKVTASVLNQNRSTAENVTVTDTLPHGLTFISAAPASGSCSTLPAANTTTAPGNDQVVCNLGSVPQGNSRAVVITVKPNAELANSEIVNDAKVSSSTEDDNPDNNTATLTLNVQPPSVDLSLTKSGPATLLLGTAGAYEVLLKNLGSSPATDVVITDTLPVAGLDYQSYSAPAGVTCSPQPATATAPAKLICALGTVAAGASIAIDVTLIGNVKGDYQNVARADSTETGQGADKRVVTAVRTAADVAVTKKEPSSSPVTLGADFTFEITVENLAGAQTAEADGVVLSDQLPGGMVVTGSPIVRVQSGTASDQTCSMTGTNAGIECQFGTVSRGASILVTVPVRVVSITALPQTFDNLASVATSSIDINPANNSRTGSVEVSGAASLSGVVFRDLNDNGVQDDGETGVPGIVMTISAADDPGITPVTTGADGSYTFTNLPLATYSLLRGPIPEGLPLNDGKVTPGVAPNGTATITPPQVTNIGITTAAERPGYNFALVPQAASVRITKALSGALTANQDGSFDAAFTLTVENDGGQDLKDLAVTDQLAGDPPFFGTYAADVTAAGTYMITVPPGGTCPGSSAGFNGSSDRQPARGFTLARDDSCTVTFAIRVRPTNPLPPLINDARYVNRASVTGTGSDSGKTVSGESDPLPLSPELRRLDLAKEMTGYDDKDGSGSVTLGDVLSYRITASNGGSVALTGVRITDDRITPDEKTCPSVAPGDSCVLTGTYTVAIADVQAKAVINTATAQSNETDDATATTRTPVVAIIGKNTLTKTALISSAKRGERVPYVIKANDVPYNPASIIDMMPPGFVFDEGSARVNGTPVKPVAEGRRLTFDGLVPDAGGALRIELTLIVGAAVNPGTSVNVAQLLNPETGQVVATARAPVTILAEAVFDCSDVIGKVFDDRNRNGYQDEGEPGLPAVRVATVNGLLITADAEGRYSVPCAAIPDGSIGSNFILKLDTATLPTGYQLTTENPRRVRLTRGKAVKLNFGAAMTRVVRLDLNGKVFVEGATALKPKWSSGLDRLVTALEAQSSILEITYRGDDGALAKARLKAVEQEVLQRWQAVPNHYELSIDTRIVSGGAQ